MPTVSEGMPVADLWRWMIAFEPERYQVAYRRLMRRVAGRKGDGQLHNPVLAAQDVTDQEGADGR